MLLILHFDYFFKKTIQMTVIGKKIPTNKNFREKSKKSRALFRKNNNHF